MQELKLYYPDGLAAGDILPGLVKKGIVVAGGLHSQIKGLWYISNLLYLTEFHFVSQTPTSA